MEKTVYFRAFEEEDAELIYKWMNDDELKKLSVGVNRRMCRDEALDWVKARMRDCRNEVWWAICAKDTGSMIGYAQLTDIHYINSTANLSGIVIGNKSYQNGFAWVETYLFIMEYAFERLGLNSLHGSSILGHKTSNAAGDIFLWHQDGISRQVVYKNGLFYDLKISSILRDEYFEHKQNGEYELKSILTRVRQITKKIKQNENTK